MFIVENHKKNNSTSTVLENDIKHYENILNNYVLEPEIRKQVEGYLTEAKIRFANKPMSKQNLKNMR